MLPLHDDNPAEITPFVTITLIGTCVMIFIYQSFLPPGAEEHFVFQYGAIPALVLGNATPPSDVVPIPAYATLLTSMFLHGSWMHLLGNMLYLWIFGNNVEDVMGHVRFITFYVVCGVCAALTHAVIDPASAIPMVGASGAISGVLGAYLLLFPRARVLIFRLLCRDHLCAGRCRPRTLVCHAGIQRRSELGRSRRRRRFLCPCRRIVAGMLLIGFFKRSDVRFFAPHRESAGDNEAGRHSLYPARSSPIFSVKSC